MIDVDPCLFISAKVICVTCADDCIMVAGNAADIDMATKSLRDLCVTLEEEDELAGFLGIHIERRSTGHWSLWVNFQPLFLRGFCWQNFSQ